MCQVLEERSQCNFFFFLRPSNNSFVQGEDFEITDHCWVLSSLCLLRGTGQPTHSVLLWYITDFHCPGPGWIYTLYTFTIYPMSIFQVFLCQSEESRLITHFFLIVTQAVTNILAL